ncbi:uncharacterized protein BDZ99DRAFT_468045 [Mytilinidion resinicola]|uniref:Malate dehydrogenase n=1 Tax=Mytilinidion resinicola TaxID=574789 RepID=A0A6A6Y4Q1_9PEZI|nr:uncharacterized protein BDZ99DRAFT_468045 [Mytilinidion resinicola]KAF2803493.1 hypothetical protein BDZ99DRAFT_468045 [Mytilinidion resinicola]
MRSTILLTILALTLSISATPYAQRPARSPIRRPWPFPPRQTNVSTGGSCDLSTTAQPANTLPAVSSGLQLALIAAGTGTQNYTCANSSSATVPVAIGAVASLTNASCAVASGNLGSINEDAAAIGMHFFVDSTTPDFDVIGLGNTELKKNAAMTAPAEADGTVDVPWLKLVAQTAGTTGAVKEVYRLVTKGGTAPATCEGQDPAAVVQVAYQAQYWFYVSTEEVAARHKRAAIKARGN